MRPAEIGFREVSEMLAQRIEALCDALRLDGVTVHGKRMPRNPTRNDRRPGSFVIDIGGNNRGRWDDFACDHYGDALDLVGYVLFGGWPISREAKREAFRWAKRWLGLSDHPNAAGAMARGTEKLERARVAHERAQAEAQRMAEDKLDRDRNRAFSTWLNASAIEPGTPAWAYLVEARKIPLDTLPRFPSVVRWTHQKHVERDIHVPCIISGMWFANGKFAAMHRIFLEPDGSAKLKRTYEGMPQKKIWPRGYLGGFIPLWRGKGLMSADVAASKGELQELAYPEGVEDGLTIACLNPDWRVWAVGMGKNFADQDPPACASAVIAVRDNDPDRKVRARINGYVQQLRERCEARDLPFMETFPARGFKDFNAMIGGQG